MFHEIFKPRLFDAWREADFFDDFERFFNRELPRNFTRSFPRINIYPQNDKILLTARLPGVDPEDVDITVHDQTVTLKGTKNAIKLKEGENYLHQERGTGEFQRKFELPFAIDPEKVKANYKNGILELQLERHESHKPRKIAIQVE